jgi:hypothetical protein
MAPSTCMHIPCCPCCSCCSHTPNQPTDRGRVPQHHVEHAVRQPRPVSELRQRQRSERRELRRLEHDRAARSNGRRHLCEPPRLACVCACVCRASDVCAGRRCPAHGQGSRSRPAELAPRAAGRCCQHPAPCRKHTPACARHTTSPHLARDHAHGEVPGADGGNHAHGLLQHQHALAAVNCLQHVAAHAPALGRKPVDAAGAACRDGAQQTGRRRRRRRSMAAEGCLVCGATLA